MRRILALALLALTLAGGVMTFIASYEAQAGTGIKCGHGHESDPFEDANGEVC